MALHTVQEQILTILLLNNPFDENPIPADFCNNDVCPSGDPICGGNISFCEDVVDMDFPEATSIGNNMFCYEGCEHLRTLEIP